SRCGVPRVPICHTVDLEVDTLVKSMKRELVWITFSIIGAATWSPLDAGEKAPAKEWKSSFPVDRKNLGPTGANPYFILQPGHRLYFANGAEKSVTTVLDETKTIDGVETRVVEDREEKNGRPVEITRD